jgi:predicted Fe-Mo cluster-binding NifX family protein
MLVEETDGEAMNQKVALPVNEVSEVVALDFCTVLLVAEIEKNLVGRKSTVELDEPFPTLRAHRLKKLQVETVLCGAVSDPLSMMLWHCGIEVISGLRGEAGRLIEAFISGQLVRFHSPDFRPGFGRRHGGCGRGRRFRGGRGGGPAGEAYW